jgi:hypothetical protein
VTRSPAEQLTGFKKHHVVAVRLEHCAATSGKRIRGNYPHRRRAFAAINRMPFAEIRNRASDAQKGIRGIGFVACGQKKWSICPYFSRGGDHHASTTLIASSPPRAIELVAIQINAISSRAVARIPLQFGIDGAFGIRSLSAACLVHRRR